MMKLKKLNKTHNKIFISVFEKVNTNLSTQGGKNENYYQYAN